MPFAPRIHASAILVSPSEFLRNFRNFRDTSQFALSASREYLWERNRGNFDRAKRPRESTANFEDIFQAK